MHSEFGDINPGVPVDPDFPEDFADLDVDDLSGVCSAYDIGVRLPANIAEMVIATGRAQAQLQTFGRKAE